MSSSSPLSIESLRAALRAMAHTIIEHADELSTLDRAIGDGDHGINMKRGFEAVLTKLDTTTDATPAALLKTVGMTLVMTVGGASGPLYGSLFMEMAKAIGERSLTLAVATDAFEAGITAIKERGRSHAGEKTMLETLVPVLSTLRQGGDGLATRIKDIAHAGAAATIPLRATKGRASFLGERSIGHMDPGARSSELLIATLCDSLVGGIPS